MHGEIESRMVRTERQLPEPLLSQRQVPLVGHGGDCLIILHGEQLRALQVALPKFDAIC